MTTEQKVLIIGDIHAEFEAAEKAYSSIKDEIEKSVDLLIQVGDFGFWPHSIADPWEKELNHKAVFVDGNHENHEVLHGEEEFQDFLERKGSLIDNPDIWKYSRWENCMDIWEHKSRGEIENGILYIGGAASVNKKHRTPGEDWFPSEDIRYKEKLRTMGNIDEYGADHIHTVISHECPSEFNVSERMDKDILKNDSNRIFLQEVLQEVEPNEWYFGHYHKKMKGECNETKWRCIDMIRPEEDDCDYVFTSFPNR